MMVLQYLDENTFYKTFLNEIKETMGLTHYNPDNNTHVDWLKKRLKILSVSGAKSICLFSDYDMPIGFITYTFDRGLDGVYANDKADINLLAVKEHHRGKGYGSMMIMEVEKILREQGAVYLCVDTYDDENDRSAITFYIKNGFTPITRHPNGQIYFYKKL